MDQHGGMDLDGLRRRDAPQNASSPELARNTVQELNAEEEADRKEAKEKKTFGRTPDGIGKPPFLQQQTFLALEKIKARSAASSRSVQRQFHGANWSPL